VDFAPSALREARRLVREAGVAVEVLEGDVLALPPSLDGSFDAVWEQTCFCAIPVEERGEYAARMARALRPGGTFFGLFWNRGREGGPPFDVTPEQVRGTFGPLFEVLSIEPVALSAPPRSNEFLAKMRVREGRSGRPSR
jgi:SAM-dependent methyltransferase